MKVCSTSALQINYYISPRLIPSLAEAVARIHEAGIFDVFSMWTSGKLSDSKVLVEFAEIGILSLRHFDLQEVSTGVPTQAQLEGFESWWYVWWHDWYIDIPSRELIYIPYQPALFESMIFPFPWWNKISIDILVSTLGYTLTWLIHFIDETCKGVEWTQGAVAWTWFGWHLPTGGVTNCECKWNPSRWNATGWNLLEILDSLDFTCQKEYGKICARV